MQTTTIGNIEIREIDGTPGKFEGLAVPFGVAIDVAYGREKFTRGAFAEAARAVNAGERIAYLNRHGSDGGVTIGVVSHLQERSDGLHFAGEFLDVPETAQARSQYLSGINGVSVEFVPGKMRRKADVVEHYEGVRLAAIAGSYAPAYTQAKIALRKVGETSVPNLTVSALSERKATIVEQIAAIRAIAEQEDRGLNDPEEHEILNLNNRMANVDALIADATVETQRRDAERAALPSRQANTYQPALVTRAESVYGPHTGNSFFGDLAAIHNRDVDAMARMARHKALVTDLAFQLERDTTTANLPGAYPTQYMPDLYVPDVTFDGPFSRFFASTSVAQANPIIIPTFASVAGDTDWQPAENTGLTTVDVTTAPITVTPKAIGGQTVVSRQAVDGASPGTDVIIGAQLREMLTRDTERAIYTVLAALTNKYTIGDTAGTGQAQSGRDLVRGFNGALADFYSVTRLLPAEGIFTGTNDWANLVAGEDSTGRPIMPFINPVNAVGTLSGASYQQGLIGGVPVEPAWAITTQTYGFIARRNDARQFKSSVLQFTYSEKLGPQAIVFAIWQYFAFAVLQPRGVQKYTYTNV